MKEFELLKIDKLMTKGLVFVWAPKEHISELLTVMEKKDFVYVENLQIVKLDLKKATDYLETTKKVKISECMRKLIKK